MEKGKHLLWKNEEFFIKLPFKKNENINPTKASHSGMNPDHLQLAKKECEELLEFDLIEPSDSQWACKAFYVNKRGEQTRGKLSDTLEEHINLLRQFEALVTQYEIMLSTKRWFLLKRRSIFSECILSKKNAPSWGEKQDEALRKIKEISKNVKSLYIPSDGKKILQTDASHEYWSAVLFEEKDGQRKICGYASGKFKDVEQHYHSNFKEILAVKNGIKKFNFFLIHTEFSNRDGYEGLPKDDPDKFKNYSQSSDSQVGSMVLSIQVSSQAPERKR
ncbi:uncharacterized protein [Nicotiana sylvestris]|uniref:uncharacterized protein n=1 Tax=Nicotiana sylvestris TaxID=4096 RepID=UPI00388C39CE